MATAVPIARLDEVGVNELRALFDGGSVGRGIGYEEAGYVLDLELSAEGDRLRGEVAGTRSRPYEVVVVLRRLALRQGVTTFSSIGSSCTCPMGGSCKHVVALLWHAHRLAAEAPEHGPRTRSWESVLGELGPARGEAQTSWTPIGVVLEEVGPTVGRGSYAAPGTSLDGPSLRLRPVVPGARGPWIRTGISWESLAGGYYARPGLRVAPQVLDAMTAIADAHRRVNRLYAYGRLPDAIPLGALGPQWFRLLREADAAGVVLMSDLTSGDGVVLAAGHARLVIDVTNEGSRAVLRPRVALPDETDPPAAPGEKASTVHLVGTPTAGGYWRRRPAPGGLCGAVELGELDRPLDAAALRLLDGPPIAVPVEDWPRFLLSALPALRRVAEVRSEDGELDLPEAVPPRLALTATFEPGAEHACLLEWSFRYGGAAHPVEVSVVPDHVDPMRDPDAERALLDALHAAVPWPRLWHAVGARTLLLPQQRLRRFDTVAFTEQLPALQAHNGLDVTVVGEPTAYTQAPEAPTIRLSATQGAAADGDWFDLGIEVRVAGEEVPLAALIAHLAQGADRMLLESGTWFTLDRPELDALRRLLEEARELQDKPSDPLRIHLVHAGLWEELVELGVVERQSRRWQERVGALLALGTQDPPQVPSGLDATLRPYQVEGFGWLALLWDAGLGGILADDMGLGKTLQMLALATRALERGDLDEPLLIVAPTSVLSTWEREAARFAPGLRTAVLGETRRKAKVPLDVAIAGAHLVITSYAVVRLDEEEFRSRRWSALVLDEAQFVKNHQAKTYQVVRRLAAGRKFAITGTPLENSLMDLWSLLSIVAPGLYPRPADFKERWSKPIESGESPEALATLRRRVRPFLLRRTKEAVAADLPPKQEQVLSVALHPRHRAVYDRHLQRERQRILGLIDDLGSNRIAILRSLTVLRQLALDPSLVDAEYAGLATSAKVDTLVEHVRELAAEGHRALVFSQFTGFLALVRAALTQAGLDHAYLDGRTRDRAKRIESFRSGTAPVFLISLKAGGFGLTLTEADYVFVLDPWWNPAAENQAIDRTHRIGQTRPVNVYRLVSAETIEEKVVALQERKRDLFSRVVDDGAMLSSALTADDIRGLLER